MNRFLIFLICILALLACTTKTERYESYFEKEYSNKFKIEVKRVDAINQTVGIMSGRVWGESHDFTYSFILNPQDVEWKGRLRQTPEKILFCKGDWYLKLSDEQVLVDSATREVSVRKSFSYLKNVDKRYFFKLLGEQYFLNVDSAEYQSQTTSCHEEPIPNK